MFDPIDEVDGDGTAVSPPRTLADDLGRFGRRRFIVGAAAAGATAAAVAPSVSASAASAYSSFLALSPDRLVDTRPGSFVGGWTRVNSSTIRVPIAGRRLADGTVVPSNATAVVLTMIGINRDGLGNFLAAFPAGSAWNNTSSLNMDFFGDTSPNLVTVRLRNGAIDILSPRPADVIVDIGGVYVASDSGREAAGRYRDIAPARRVLDTRNSPGIPGPNSVTEVDISALIGRDIDADAIAVSVNLTSTQSLGNGYLTAYPHGEERGPTSSLNVVPGQDRAIGAIIKLRRDSRGRYGFKIFSLWGGHLIVDVNGFFTGPSANRSTGGMFVPVDPVRLMDTRRGHGGKKRLWAGWTREFALPSSVRAEAGTVVLNTTVTRSMGPGFFTVNAARERTGTPTTSSVNVNRAGQTVANHVISKASVFGCEVYSWAGGDVIADLVGYFKTNPSAGSKGKQPDPLPPQAAPSYTLIAPTIPVMNAGRRVDSFAMADPIVDQGLVWHWSGTGFVGNTRSNIGLFAHRTDAGGPFRHVEDLGPGDLIFLKTGDQRTYAYRYVNRHLTTEDTTEILAAARRDVPGRESVSLIACTVGFDRTKSRFPDAWAPTSLLFRIVVNFVFEFWVDDIPLEP